MNAISDRTPAYTGAVPDSWTDKLNEMRQVADKMAETAKDAPVSAKQQLLSSLLKQCEAMNSGLYTGKSWNALMKAYARGKGISLADSPSLKNLKRAINELNAAFGALETAEKADEDDEARDGLPLVLKLGGQDTSAASAASGGVQAAAAGAEAAVDISV